MDNLLTSPMKTSDGCPTAGSTGCSPKDRTKKYGSKMSQHFGGSGGIATCKMIFLAGWKNKLLATEELRKKGMKKAGKSRSWKGDFQQNDWSKQGRARCDWALSLLADAQDMMMRTQESALSADRRRPLAVRYHTKRVSGTRDANRIVCR